MPLTNNVSQNIEILKKEHPDWSMDHVLAAAINSAHEHKKYSVKNSIEAEEN